jgi:hypothetical protein
MPLARVVSFDAVGEDGIAQLRARLEGERPEGMPATEVLALHDAATERALVILFFESEDDYRQGDAVLDAMPAGDTPGRRAKVEKYEVAVRRQM